MSNDLSSLDDLFKQAKAAALLDHKAKELKAQRKSIDALPAADPQLLYTNPDNWRRTRGVALIHADTETLLGNFSEYVHVSVAGCRRLVREETPISISVTERVAGDWWIAARAEEIEPRQEWHTKQPAILHIHLDKLCIHAPLCEVVAHLSYGGIARVELALDTTFAQVEGAQEQLVFLPAGTNILGEMSFDNKIELRKELGI